MEFSYVDLKTLTKDENLYAALRDLQHLLKSVHGNTIHLCKGRSGIIIRGYVFVTEQMDLCTNVCLHVVKSGPEDINNPLDYCEKTCGRFVASRAQATLIENYSKLIYTLAKYGLEFRSRLGEAFFQTEIKS